MDAAPTPGTSTSLDVEVTRSLDGRLNGQVRSSDQPWRPFSGVLELLKVLEEILDAGEHPSTGGV